MSLNQEELLLKLYGEMKEIKALLTGMQGKQDEQEQSLLELEGRVRRLEKIVWMAIGAVGVIEPVVFEFIRRLLH